MIARTSYFGRDENNATPISKPSVMRTKILFALELFLLVALLAACCFNTCDPKDIVDGGNYYDEEQSLAKATLPLCYVSYEFSSLSTFRVIGDISLIICVMWCKLFNGSL